MAQAFSVMIAGIAKGGMEEYVENILAGIMAHAQAAPGCITYNIHQSDTSPSEFMVYMLWESKAAYDQNNQTPAMQEFKKQLAPDLFVMQSPKTFWHLIHSDD